MNLLTIALLNDQKHRAQKESFNARRRFIRLDHAAEYLHQQNNNSDSLDLLIEADKYFLDAKKWDRIARRYELAIIAEETEVKGVHE